MSQPEYKPEEEMDVKDISVGDLVDLSHCPHLSHHEIVEFEYGEVSEIDVETDNCIVLSYCNLSLSAGYGPADTLRVQKRITPLDD